MFRIKHGLICASAALMFVFVISASRAQISPFGKTHIGQGLNETDVDILFGAAKTLNDARPLHVGETRDWSNPETGNSGVVTVMRIFNSGTLSCHTLRYDLSFRKPKPGTTYTVDWCKTYEGWKIKS